MDIPGLFTTLRKGSREDSSYKTHVASLSLEVNGDGKMGTSSLFCAFLLALSSSPCPSCCALASLSTVHLLFPNSHLPLPGGKAHLNTGFWTSGEVLLAPHCPEPASPGATVKFPRLGTPRAHFKVIMRLYPNFCSDPYLQFCS